MTTLNDEVLCEKFLPCRKQMEQEISNPREDLHSNKHFLKYLSDIYRQVMGVGMVSLTVEEIFRKKRNIGNM